MTPFDDWLRQLAAAGKLAANGLLIDRGLPLRWLFGVRGEWASPEVSSSLRLSPDAGGAPLVTIGAAFVGLDTFATAQLPYVATPAGYENDPQVTIFVLALADYQTAALPPDTDGDGVVRLAWDVLFKDPALDAGVQRRLFGGVAIVLGKVT